MNEKTYRMTVVLLLLGILVVQIYATFVTYNRTPTLADLRAASKDPRAKETIWARLPIVLLKGSLDTLDVSGDVSVSGTVDIDKIDNTVDVKIER